MRTWLTLPTLFTLARVALTPLILRAVFDGRPVMALALFAVAAATDGIDGYLARRLRVATAAGAVLDPIADKLLLSGVYLVLAITGSLPWWLVAVVFGRDLLILASASVALLVTQLRAFPPSIWGKASTAMQILTAVAFLARNAFGSSFLTAVSAGLIWPTAVLTIWSGVHYGWRGVRMARRKIAD